MEAKQKLLLMIIFKKILRKKHQIKKRRMLYFLDFIGRNKNLKTIRRHFLSHLNMFLVCFGLPQPRSVWCLQREEKWFEKSS